MDYSCQLHSAEKNDCMPDNVLLGGFGKAKITYSDACDLLKSSEDECWKKSELGVRSVENAGILKKHDATLKRWNDNVETARAMCADELDKSVNDQLKIAIKQNNATENNITFDENKGVFFYKNGNQTAKFKVIQGCNGKHLLQITISGRLSQEKLENRIEEVVSELSKYGSVKVQESGDGKRTLNLNGTEIILPSKMVKHSRVSFKLEHNRIHFQGENYKNDMENVFGKNNVPFNASGSFPVKEKTSDDIWRDQCVRQVKSMISPTVNIVEEDGENKKDNSASIKAPVSCYLNLLSMNIMLNSILENYNNSDDFDEPVVAYDKSVVSIAGNLFVVINDGEEDPFQSWINTLNSVHQAYGEYTKRIVDLKCNCGRNNTTFVAEEAVLRQHEALLRKLFVEATNRAEKVLELDILSKASNIHLLDKEEISDMEFSSANEIMSNVIQMFVEEQRAKAEESQQGIAKLSEEAKELREAVEERDDRIRELTQQLDAEKKTSKKAIEDLNSQMLKLQGSIDEQTDKINELNNVIKQQTKRIDELNQAITQKSEGAQDKISGLEEEMQKLNKTLEERNEKIAELEKNIESLKKQIEDLSKNAVQKAAGDNSAGPMNVNSVNYVSGNGVYGMQPVGDDMKKEMEELKLLCEEQQKTIKRLEDEIARLRQDLNGLEAERDDWKRKYEEQADELNEIKESMKKMRDASNGLAEKTKEANAELDQYEPGHREIDQSYSMAPEPLNFDDLE